MNETTTRLRVIETIKATIARDIREEAQHLEDLGWRRNEALEDVLEWWTGNLSEAFVLAQKELEGIS